jgi:hypothetical protein
MLYESIFSARDRRLVANPTLSIGRPLSAKSGSNAGAAASGIDP